MAVMPKQLFMYTLFLSLFTSTLGFVSPTFSTSSFISSKPLCKTDASCQQKTAGKCFQSHRASKVWLKNQNGQENEEDISGLKDGLTQTEFASIVEKEKDFEKAMNFLRQNKKSIDLGVQDFQLASQMISLMSEKVIDATDDELEMLEDARSEELYRELKRQGLLRGYGCVTAESYPVTQQSVGPDDMQQIINLPIEALTPSGTYDNYWLSLGAGLCALEFFVGSYFGIDPLDTLIPLTAGIILIDRIFIGGVFVDQALRKLVPGFEEKIIKHEAGHFLVAYLLGCPIQGCILNPVKLRNFVNAGQGGTLFTDPAFVKEVKDGTMSRRTIDRFAIILMAGIAAEALEYGNADGGQGDEFQLIQILQTISPPWNMNMVKEEARWAAAQAVLLITEHKAVYEALVAKIKQNAPLGECIKVIEQNLPEGKLPAEKRLEEQLRLQREKEEMISLAEANLDGEDVSKVRQLKDDALKLAANLQEKLDNPDLVEKTLDGGVWLNDLKAVKQAEVLPPQPMVKPSVSYKVQIQKIEEEQQVNSQKLEEIEKRLQELEEEEAELKTRLAAPKKTEN